MCDVNFTRGELLFAISVAFLPHRFLAWPLETRSKSHRLIKQPGLISVIEHTADSLHFISYRHRAAILGDAATQTFKVTRG